MEGCKACENYEFGCCDDGLTEASGPDGQASCNLVILVSSRYIPIVFFTTRVVAVRARDTAAASTGLLRPLERTSWAAPPAPGRTAAWSP